MDSVTTQKMVLTKTAVWLLRDLCAKNFIFRHYVLVEGSKMKHEPFYIHRPKWREMTTQFCQTMLDEGCIEKVDEKVAAKYHIKFLVKLGHRQNKLRPVALSQEQPSSLTASASKEQLALLQYADRTLFKFSVDTKGDNFGRLWASFLRKGLRPPFYVVIADIKDAFGSVDHELLVTILTEYVAKRLPNQVKVVEYATTKGRPKAVVQSSNEKLGRLKPSKQLKKWSSVNVATVLADIAFRIRNRTIKFSTDGRGTAYLVKRGLLQGDFLSSSLCNIYLGHMVQSHLGEFTDPASNLLARAVDDFIFVTPDIEAAKKFRQAMSRGFPEYGINCHKFASNLDDGELEHEDLVFCGIRVTSDNAQLSPDVTSYFKQNIAYSVSFRDQARNDFLVRRTRFLPKIKMQSAFLDECINGRTRTLSNLFALHYVNILRVHTMLDSVVFSKGLGNVPGDVVDTIFDICLEVSKSAFSHVVGAHKLKNTSVHAKHSEIMMILAIRTLLKHKGSKYGHHMKEKIGRRAVKREYEDVAQETYSRLQLKRIVARAYQKF